MKYLGLILVLVVSWSLQVYLAYQQNKTIIQEIGNIQTTRHSGHLGVGQKRSLFNFGSGVILILVTDNDGQILEARKLQGFTVFKRFTSMESLLNLSVIEAFNQIEDQRVKDAFVMAVNHINQEREKSSLSELMLV